MAAIEFKLDLDRSREAIVYLASKTAKMSPSTGFDVYHACKLLFLADKLHLVRYGRTITGDRYFAMDHGPAPNRILNRLRLFIEDSDAPWLSTVLTIDRTYKYPRFHPIEEIDYDHLSESDIEALEETVARYGTKTFPELRALTHEMAAYQKAWANRGNKGSAPMAFEDFFEEDSDAIAGVLEEAIDASLLREAIPDKLAV
jgi:uncharacterized phage-associated protein